MPNEHVSHRPVPPTRPSGGLARSLAAAALAAGLVACGSDDAPEGGGQRSMQRPSAERSAETLRRERVTVLFTKEQLGDARAELAPLLAGKEPATRDLVTDAQIALRLGELDDAVAAMERATALDPADPAVLYTRARIALLFGEPEDAAALFQRVLDAVPNDPAAKVGLAEALYTGEDGEEDETLMRVRRLLEEVAALGIEDGLQWYVTAVYKRFRLALGTDEPEEVQRVWTTLWGQQVAQGYEAASQQQLDPGELARVVPPAPFGTFPAEPPKLPAFGAPFVVASLAGPPTELHLADVDGDRLSDVVALIDGAVHVVVRAREGGAPSSGVALTGVTGPVRLMDLNQRRGGDTLDVVAAAGDRLLIAEQSDDPSAPAWVPSPIAIPAFGGRIRDFEPVDFDHDGDLDLFVVGDFGARLLRNDGVGAARFGAIELPRKPAIADFDGDARPDLFVPGADRSLLLRQLGDGTFQATELPYAVPADASAPIATDLDLDGAFDVVWGTAGGPFGAGVLGLATSAPTPFELPPANGASGALRVHDVDGPDLGVVLGLEVVRARGNDVVAIRATEGLGEALYLRFVGQKDNRQAVGAVLEVRSGDLYTRRFLRGDAAIVGVGPHASADVVRITWPNGVVGQNLDVQAGAQFFLDHEEFGEQPEGLIGSCPFLYTWNGETFEFISDVIGITPLGLPMATGMLVPPDHDEYVLVRGDQLRPDADGHLVLQFTEELREVTYLDRVRLDAIDHPAGTEIFPNELFKFPPFPEPHTHVIERVAEVKRAIGSDGADWTAELQRIDFRHPRPFERLGGQYLGLAEPHFLELEFDPRDLEGASLVRLVATGWFYWSDASVNVAAALTPDVEFVPPTLSVPGPDGTWVPAGPPIGFPAGKTKTMVVDITDVIQKDDPRIRIGSTLELYWDRIQLATCNDDAPLQTSSLEAISAEVWSRGFSKPIEPERADLPLFFDWNEVESRPRWNQHPGKYTRYGDVLPLLGAIDDRYVIMGSGDALTLRFDAAMLPPVPEGYVRDYLVFLDGWAKDRDPNTYEALEVEPLPFHGMSGYPYGPDESFPTDAAHEAWRAEWNTRSHHDWIVPLSPRREGEWLRAALQEL